MIEPVALENFFIAFFSAAMVIICGALYALLFAYSRVHHQPRLMPLAYGAYGLHFTSVMVLAYAMNLHGFWQIVVVAMLVGYLLAPHGIWYLCQGTHTAEPVGAAGGGSSSGELFTANHQRRKLS